MRSVCIIFSLALTFGTIAALPGFVSAATPPSPAQDIAAKVNGETITYQALNTEFRARTRVPFERVQADPQAQRIRKQILEQMIDEKLLGEQAMRGQISVEPEMVNERFQNVQARFPSEAAFTQELNSRGLTPEQLKNNIRKGLMTEQLINKEVIDKVSVSPAELEPYFQKHRDDYVQEEAVHARHILIKVASDASPEDDQKAKDRAEAVLAKAKKGEDFAQLAKQHSEGPSSAQEGDLGYFGRGKMIKPFEDAAFTIKVGEISGLVRTQFGYHIIKVEDKLEAKQLSYKEAEDQVKKDLTREKTIARYGEYIKGLREKATVTVNLE